MQIARIILYHASGATRTVDFKLGAVNVITGGPSRGKSSLISIIDYCLGSRESDVPAGVIADSVAWYAVLFQFGHEQVFVARAAPVRGRRSNSSVRVVVGADLQIPALSELEPNATPEGVVTLLSGMLGIPSNTTEPQPGQTRAAFGADLRHALLFCLQRQDEIALPKFLFHRQGDPFIPQTLKDTLPFFLGAAADDRLARRRDLRDGQARAKELEQRIASIATQGASVRQKISELLAEAKRVGLISQEQLEGSAEPAVLLRGLLTWTASAPSTVEPDGQELSRLQDRHDQTLDAFYKVQAEIALARSMEDDRKGFEREAMEQRSRLESIGFFDDPDGATTCPLCESHLAVAPASVSVMKTSLADIQRKLEHVERHRPRLKEFVEGREQQLAARSGELTAIRGQINGLVRQREALQGAVRLDEQRARTVGRISAALESLETPEDAETQERELAALAERNEALRLELSRDELLERLDSILNIIGKNLSSWAKTLALQYSDAPLRIDVRKLTVVADTPKEPVPLDRMGGGGNWVGYHVLAHLALHAWFVGQNRPVPRFLFLDQPTQAYYPQEHVDDENLVRLKDPDRDAVKRLFDMIFTVGSQLAPAFQIIVTDHAFLKDSRFRDAVIENWRGDLALVPEAWITKPETPSAPALEEPGQAA